MYQQKILEQRSRLGGVNASAVNNQLIARQIRLLENRLEKNLAKFNETVARNRELRRQIDEHRRERVIFDGIYKKLERELHEKKKEMAAIIEDSKHAHQLRERAQSELQALKQHAEKEKSDFEQEFRELGELVRQQQVMLAQIRLQQFEAKPDTDNTSIRSVEQLHGESQNRTQAMYAAKDKAQLELSQEQLQSFETALQQIQEATGEHTHTKGGMREAVVSNATCSSCRRCFLDDNNAGIQSVDEIITRFLEAEEQNFSLFNYVNDVNSEIERLEQAIAEMRNKIEKYRGQGMSSDSQRRRALRDLEDKLSRVQQKIEEHEQRYQKSMRVISQLKNGIHSIFTRIGAASSSVEELLGNQGVTESNMLQYLGIIEQRTSELLQMYTASQMGQTVFESSLQLPVPVPSGPTPKLHVVPPSYDEVSSGDEHDDEEDERPLTRQELEGRTKVQYSRKEGGKRGKGVLTT